MKKSNLRAATALQAIALMGAGFTTAFIAATPAAAQSDYTNVTANGRVLDAAGRGIQGATVTVTSNQQGFTRVTTTDAAGGYTIPSLPQGNYTFTITAAGHQTFTDPNVQLNVGSSGNEFQLGAAGAPTRTEGGAIVVTGRRTRTSDLEATTTGAVVNIGELAERVPVARDITSVVLMAPATSLGDPAFGSLPSIQGSSVSENTYYINGLNITNIRNGLGAVTVPFDFYQTVEVKTGGYSAEFGRATGGFINAITKSGANQPHGGVTFNWEPDSLAKDSPNTYLSDNDADEDERREAIVQLSGPIIKDRLFAYGLYQFRDVYSAAGSTSAVNALDPRLSTITGLPLATPPVQAVLDYSCFMNPSFCVSGDSLSMPLPSNIPATGESNTNNRYIQFALAGTQYVVTRNTSPFWGVKFDALPLDNHRLEFTAFNTKSETRNAVSGTNRFSLASGCRYNPNTNDPGCPLPPEFGGSFSQLAGGLNYVGRYTGTFTDWLTFSAAYGRNKNRAGTISSGPDYPSIADTRPGVTVPLGNPVANLSRNDDRRDFYRADVDVRFNAFGSHHVRFGYDREDLLGSSITQANGLYQVTYFPATAFGTATEVVSRRFFQNGGEFKTQGEAYYIEDSWKLFNDRLNLNLGLRNDRFTNENNEGDAFFESGDNWAPRLGFSFDVLGDRTTKIYGAFSRYFLGIPVNTNTRLAGPELDYTQYFELLGTDDQNLPILGAAFNNNDDMGTHDCPALTVDTVGGTATENCTVNQAGLQPPYKTLVAANLKAQTVDEWLIGAERRLGGGWRVGAYYTERKLIRSLEDAYVDAGVQAWCEANLSGIELQNPDFGDPAFPDAPAGCLDIFTGAHQYALINPGSDAVITLLAEGTFLEGQEVTLTAEDLALPKAKRKYKGLTITVDRDFDGRFSVGGSYTLSSLKGNIEGGIRSDNGQVDSGLTTAFDFPALMNGGFGFLPGHRKHNIKAYGSYRPFEWLTLGANLQIQSPRKYGCIGRVPNTVDPVAGAGYGASGWYCNVVDGEVVLMDRANGFVFSNSFDPDVNTLSLTPRGSRLKSDWLTQLNVDAGVRLPVKAFDSFFRVSVFNVLNRKAVVDLQEVGTASSGAPSATYGQPLTYQAPRYVRFQLGVNF